MKKILYLIKKEFIQTFRDRKMLPLIFVAPIIQVLLLGYAVRTDIDHINLGIWNMDNTSYSRQFTGKVLNCGYFDYTGTVSSDKELNEDLKKGKYDFVLYFPPDFGRKAKRMEKATFEIIADGSDSNLTMIGLNYLNQITQRENIAYQDKALGKLSAAFGKKVNVFSISPEIRVLYNQELNSANYMVPGVICLILTITTMMLTSMAITKEKEFGTIEQLIVSPLKPYEIILGKTIPFVIIGMFEVVLVLTAGMLLFKIPIKGSIVLLFVASLLFIISALGLGLFVSTISRTQQQAMLSTFIFLFPAMIISGFAFPVTNMPLLMQYLSYLVPLKYFLVIIRGIFMRGSGLDILWPQFLALLIFGIALLGLSGSRFKKKLS